MSIHAFRSMKNEPDEPTPDDLAHDLALEMIERIKVRRLEAQTRELRCEESLPWNELDKEAYDTLEAMIGTPNKPGRHRRTVLTLLFEHFPELVAKTKLVN